MAQETVTYNIKVDADTQTLKQMADRVDEIKKEMEGIPIGSKRFKELKTELIQVDGALKNVELGLESLDTEQVAGQVGALGGAVGSVTGAFVLLGGEGGAIQETAQNIERAMGLTMAFQGTIEGLMATRKLYNSVIKNSTAFIEANNMITKVASVVQKVFTGSVNTTTVGFQQLKKAIIATGIGALVVAVGLLIANFDKLKGLLSGISSQQKDALIDQEKLTELAKERVDAIGQMEETLKRQGKTEREILNMKIKATNEAIIEQQIRLDMVKQQAKAQLEAEKRNKKLFIEFNEWVYIIPRTLVKGVDLFGEKLLGVINKVRDTLGQEPIEFDLGLSEKVDKLNESVVEFIFDPETVKETTDETVKEQEKALANLINQRDGFLNTIDDQNKAQAEKNKTDNSVKLKAEQDAYLKRQAMLLKHQQAMQKLEDDFRAKLESETDLFNEQFMSEQEVEIQAVEDKYFELISLAEQYGEDTALLEANRVAKLKEINDKFDEERKQSAIERAELEVEVENTKFDMAVQGIDSLMALNDAFTKDNEKSQKKAFERNKKLQIAQAIIQTYQGANAIFASAAANPSTVLFPAQPFIAAGIAIATGLANVATISKQQFQSSSEGGGGSIGVPSGITAPNLAPTNTSTLIPQDEEGNLTQVYVTETDITNTQNKVSVIETQATF